MLELIPYFLPRFTSVLLRLIALGFSGVMLVIGLPAVFLAGAAPQGEPFVRGDVIILRGLVFVAVFALGYAWIGVYGPELARSRVQRVIVGLFLGFQILGALWAGGINAWFFGMLIAFISTLFFTWCIWPLWGTDSQGVAGASES